jgi:hypothetical protein
MNEQTTNQGGQKVKVTQLEKAVLAKLYESANGNGHDFGFIEDARSAVKNPRELAGVISSLVKKGIIVVWDAVTTDSGTFTQFTWEQTKADEELANWEYASKRLVEKLVGAVEHRD